jgi:hypothetical protein
MIRVYARENATQRGNTSTALAGTVASAIRYLAKGILTGTFSTIGDKPVDVASARGNLTSDKGLGERLVLEFVAVDGDRRGATDRVLGAYVLPKIGLDREADRAVRRNIGNGPRKLVDASARGVEFGLFRCVVFGHQLAERVSVVLCDDPIPK